MWVGTFSGGVNLSNRDASVIAHYRRNTSPNSLSNNNVLAFSENSRGQIWIGTDGGGLDLFDPLTGKFTTFRHRHSNAASVSNDYIQSLRTDRDGNLWAGTVGAGLNIIDQKGKVIRVFKNDPNDSSSIGGDNIDNITHDPNGDMWVAINGGGLDLYHTGKHNFSHFTQANGSLSSDRIRCMLADSYDRLWIATYDKGLDMLDKRTWTFHHFAHSDTRSSLSSNSINSLLEAVEIDLGEIELEDVGEAALRQAPMQRHLAAFKTLDAHAGTRGLALAAAARLLALARTDATADAHALFARAGIVGDIAELHRPAPCLT